VNNFDSSYEVDFKVAGTYAFLTGPAGNFSYYQYSGDMTVTGRYPELYQDLKESAVPLDTETEAVERCLKSISSMQVNLAQAFAEHRKSAKLLVSSINRLASFALQVRKGNFLAANRILFSRTGRELPELLGIKLPRGKLQDAAVKKASELLLAKAGPATKKFQKRNLTKAGAPRHYEDRAAPTKDDFGSIWLEYSYGWRPLVKDIEGAAELLARTFDPYFTSKPPVTAATGSCSKTGNLKQQVHNFTGYTTYNFATSGSVNQRTKCVVRYQVSDSTLNVLRKTGISNPALLAWELLPYSFVVDWLLNVSRYLENVNASQGLHFHSGFITTIREWNITATVSESNIDGSSFGQHFKKGARIVRRRIDSFPTATFPSVEMNLGLSKAVSGLALINQLFSR
jgi:hypothetical protein